LFVVLNDVFVGRIGYENVVFRCCKRTIILIVATCFPTVFFRSVKRK
jgi:hypothetical protein